MIFEPKGGFPSIIKISQKIPEKTLEQRGFDKSIVSISEIMNSKKNDNFFAAFGINNNDDDQSRIVNAYDYHLDNKPYNNFDFTQM